jgi:hypothetical protein
MFIKAGSNPAAVALDLRDVRPIDLYDAWLFAEAEATLALRAWRMAARPAKAETSAAYRAALDREEHAARVLAGRLGA